MKRYRDIAGDGGSNIVGQVEDQQARLRRQLAARPDASLEQHCRQWAAEQGTAVSASAMRRAIQRVAWTRKKRRSPPANATRPPASGGATPPSTWT